MNEIVFKNQRNYAYLRNLIKFCSLRSDENIFVLVQT